MKKYITILLLIAVVAAAAYQDWKQGKSVHLLTLHQIKTAFVEEGIPLKPVPGATYFKLYGKEPEMYEADGSDFAIYVYNTTDSIQKALADFEIQTADVKAVLFEIYKVRNVLIFEARELPAPSAKVVKAIEALR